MADRTIRACRSARHTASTTPPKPPIVCNIVEVAEDLPEPVFGQYPTGLIPRLLPWLLCDRHALLHVCSGNLREGIRVDIRRTAHPDVIADGRALPFADGSMAAVLIDPPYTRQFATDLYGCDYPRPSHLLREAARVVRPAGRIGMVHYLVPMPPPACRLIKILGLSTGMGQPIRAVTIWEREQDKLFND